jgi:putative spermidine/putrescine transport system permease protein
MLGRMWRTRLLMVFLALVVLFMICPVIFVVLSSFNSVAYNTFPPKGFSLRWYKSVLQSPVFISAFRRSVVVAGLTTLLTIAVGTAASFAIVRYRFSGRSLTKSFLLTPVVTPKTAIGLSSFILALRLNIYGSLTSIVLCHAVIALPYVISMVSTSLAGLDRSLEEAAMDLGATRTKVLSRVIIPQIRPSLAVSAVFAFLRSFEQVNATIFLVRPANNTLPVEMFLYLERFQDPTIAAVASLLVAMTIATISIVGFGGRESGPFGISVGG